MLAATVFDHPSADLRDDGSAALFEHTRGRLGHRGSFRRRSGRRAYSNEPKIRPRVSAIYCTMVLVDTLVSGVHNEGHVECCGHADEFGERIDSHLPHDLASVGFHSDLADTERLLRTLRSL